MQGDVHLARGGRRASLKAVTIRDVARKAKVSVASASRALNDLDNVTESMRERVLGAARSLRYVPHTGARSLITRRTDTIGLVLPDLHGDFFSEVIRGVDMAAHARGLHLLVSNSHGRPAEAAAAIRSMRGRVDGLLIMSPHVDADLLAENLSDDLPTVLMNTRVEGQRYPSFQVDNYGGAYAIVAHLVERGHRQVVHIAGQENNVEAGERRRGYLAAMADLAPEVEPRIVQGDFSEESGRRAGLSLAPDPPQAVFAANDTMAIGCLVALRAAGLRVPDDIALAGFDDVPLARLITPALTTMRVDIADVGARAVARLVDGTPSVGDAMLEVRRPQLIVRATTTARNLVATEFESEKRGI